MFGYQVKNSIRILNSKLAPVDTGSSGDDIEERLKFAKQFTALIMQVIISILVIIVSFYLLIKPINDTTTKAASSFIGLVIGYWIR